MWKETGRSYEIMVTCSQVLVVKAKSNSWAAFEGIVSGLADGLDVGYKIKWKSGR